VFDFLCFNSGNSRNESKDDCVGVHEDMAATTIIDLIDGCTIPCIEDVGASSMEKPLYLSRGHEMESHFCRNDNLEVSPLHIC
jgi:hypothetical protein